VITALGASAPSESEALAAALMRTLAEIG
jgi:hypothetical protein